MTTDYYETLGVSKNATKEEIKKAYKRLAKKHHPDLNKEEGSEKKFKELNEAAAILGDDEKRARYDQFGNADQFKNAQGAGGFDFSGFGDFASFDFGDIFDQFFSGGQFGGGRQQRRPQQGSHIRADIEITLEEAATGTSKTITVPRIEQCEHCKGSGAKTPQDLKTCDQCQGSGSVRRTQQTPFGMFATTTTCNVCRGKGKMVTHECDDCKGAGIVKKTRQLEINIPAGAEEGTNLRLRGEGEAGEYGAEQGDLFVIIHMIPHDSFERRGDDIHLKSTISFGIAALGGEITVPTLDGEATLKIPAGTQPQTIFRMRGKGIPYLHGQGKGDQYVEVMVEVPKKLTKKQKELLEEFEKGHVKKKGLFR